MMGTAPLFGEEQSEPTSDDYYTPRWVFDAMGLEFDLDVAAPPGGVPWIPAKRYFTMADDGLAQPWEGLVWCNPPFSNATAWAQKWFAHANGIFLGPLGKSAWVFDLLRDAELAAIPHRRFQHFERPGDKWSGSISFPWCMWALGGPATTGLLRLRDAGYAVALSAAP